MNLRLDWCTHKAARYAVENWHYSGVMPAGKRVFVGVWEGGTFIGVVMFGTGAAPQAACPFGVRRQEVCELVRVALRSHTTPVTRIVAQSLRFLRRVSPKIRIVVSYADPEQGHLGVIYQAGNWVFLGKTKLANHYRTKAGKFIHSKTLATGHRGRVTRLLATGAISIVKTWKYKYAMPMDKVARTILAPMAKPYPKRAGSDTSDTPVIHTGEGGATPTPALPPVATEPPREKPKARSSSRKRGKSR